MKVRKQKLEDAIRAAAVEQWQINPAVHFNEWANLGRKDFAAVVAAHKELVAQFHCPTCRGLLEVTPPRGSKEHLLCACGNSSVSFAAKSKVPA